MDRFKVGDQAVTTRRPSVYDRTPGEVIEVFEDRPGKWWARVEFTVHSIEPVDQLGQWCPECKNLGGRWICSLGDTPGDRSLCNSRCHCPGEHEYELCPAMCETRASIEAEGVEDD